MTFSHRGLAMLVGAALAVAPVGAVAAKTHAAHTHASKGPAIYTVTLQQMKFGPTPASIHVGDTIEWVNNDIFVHSATASNHAFDVELPVKAHRWTTFHAAGTYAFNCRYHPGMTGTLVVTN